MSEMAKKTNTREQGRAKGAAASTAPAAPLVDNLEERTVIPRTDGTPTRVLEHSFLARLGKHVSTLRKGSGLTQGEVAEKIGVHRSYIGFIEQGRRNPSIATLYRLSIVLGTPLEKIFDYDPNAEEPKVTLHRKRRKKSAAADKPAA
jgi:DNA-binding XRE family transcriptional regulator